MAGKQKRIQLAIVVETDEASMTDDPYYTWILRNHFGNYVLPNLTSPILLIYHFIHLGGWGNYQSPKTKREISAYASSFPKGDTYVIYCLDYDNKGSDTQKRIESVKTYCDDKGYFFSLAYREIEHVMKVAGKGRTKIDAVSLFKKRNPKKTEIEKRMLFSDCDSVTKEDGTTNFGTAIESIIDDIKSKLR